MSSIAAVVAPSDLVEVALGLGDDCLVLSHRLSEWTARAPEFEEDVAMANLALDLLGQARNLLTLAGELEGRGRDEDELAYLRDDRQFRNLLLVEQPNGDFAVTMARQLFFSTYQVLLYRGLAQSSVPALAGIAAKGVKEARYHLEHATLWTLRLGDGTEESHLRMQAAVDHLWPFTGEPFLAEAAWSRLCDARVVPDLLALRERWQSEVQAILREARLECPEELGRQRGGRAGLHSEHLGHLLAEMQHLHRSHPNVTW
ncbi:MAG: 1,2-phenylacetyl-CoA epoxidase subunit PaaC [Candidatus Dormiibacterota bacterium]